MDNQDHKINTYKISRELFDWSFNNPDKIKPSHIAIYFYSLDLNNRFGWKDKFGFPTLHAMEATGIKSKNTFYNAFNELVEWGFIVIITKSKNQNTANIITIPAVSNFKSANDKPHKSANDKPHKSAMDLANIQQEYSGGNIDKQVNHKTLKQVNQKQEFKETCETTSGLEIVELRSQMQNEFSWRETLCRNMKEIEMNFDMEMLDSFLDQFFKLIENDGEETKTVKDCKKHFSRWLNKEVIKVQTNEKSTNNSQGASNAFRAKTAKRLGIVPNEKNRSFAINR